jgi:hypothetical protein
MLTVCSIKPYTPILYKNNTHKSINKCEKTQTLNLIIHKKIHYMKKMCLDQRNSNRSFCDLLLYDIVEIVDEIESMEK